MVIQDRFARRHTGQPPSDPNGGGFPKAARRADKRKAGHKA
jgi:hypothetical protein